MPADQARKLVRLFSSVPHGGDLLQVCPGREVTILGCLNPIDRDAPMRIKVYAPAKSLG